jgi:hypothetical protein
MMLPAMARFRDFAGTRRVHFGTGGHLRARATSRGAAWDADETGDRDDGSESSCKPTFCIARGGAKLTISFAREVVALFMVETRRSHFRFGRVETEREAGLDLTH